MLFHYGRTFEINDLAVDPAYQRRGIGSALPELYARFGFSRATEVMLMGMEM